MSSRRYAAYCIAVGVALVAGKLWLATAVPSSALFADDYEYLNRAIYLLHGDVQLTGYPFGRVPYGPLYSLAVSPWMLVSDPSLRLTVVFGINALLSAIVVLCGSLTVFRLTNTASLLVPICLATFAPLFQFSFYAMSENLLFPLLAVLGLLSVDFDATCRRTSRLLLLLLLAVMLPLVRVPGLAVTPALVLLLWMNRHELAGRRIVPYTIAAAILLSLVSYYGFYQIGLESWREARYLHHLRVVTLRAERLLFPLRLTGAQAAYLLLSTAYWVVPVLAVVASQVRASPDSLEKRRWRNYLTYAVVTSGTFVAFTLVHLIEKLRFRHPDFIYGRYDDPAGLLLVIGGLAAVLWLRPLTRLQGIVLRVAAPLALCFALAEIWDDRPSGINESGLALFGLALPPLVLLLGAVTATLLNQLSDRRDLYARAAQVFFIGFCLLTNWAGMTHTIARAQKGAHSLEAAGWIAANVPVDATIGYDGRVGRWKAPGGVKEMMGVYRAMLFGTYPRRCVLVNTHAELQEVDYLYTLSEDYSRTEKIGDSTLTDAWTNGAYVLYRVAKGE
jgi:hypothetical protein